MNGPYYHLNAHVYGAWFHDFVIEVDVLAQKNIGKILAMIPFPLNTDGIDPSGTDILIERVNITNYDDSVAVKPSANWGQCSERITIRDLNVWYSVGLTIGSVGASDGKNCVRNVTF